MRIPTQSSWPQGADSSGFTEEEERDGEQVGDEKGEERGGVQDLRLPQDTRGGLVEWIEP